MIKNEKLIIEGFCKYCGEKLSFNEMQKHLDVCEKRLSQISEIEEGKKEEGFFEIAINSREDKNYWIIIEAREKTMLKEIDTFIRRIWIGDSLDMSKFEIKKINYKYRPEGELFFKEPDDCMYHVLKNLLSLGETFSYKYSGNKPINLKLKIIGRRVGVKTEEDDVVILSRNIQPEIICDKCKKNKATWIDPELYIDNEGAFYCDECMGEMDETDEEYFLKISNSPRMGIAGYNGSDFYLEEFEPDAVKEELKEYRPRVVDKNNLEKFKDGQKNNYLTVKKWKKMNKPFKELESTREEPTIEEWRELYEVAAKIKDMKPWEFICSFDTIKMKNASKEPVFYSIIGDEGEIFGVNVYEGYRDFSTYFMEEERETLNLSKGYVRENKSCLSCFWGYVSDTTPERREVIRKLDIKRENRKDWLCFLSFEPGYCPYIMDKNEVIRMTEHLKNLEIIIEKYIEKTKEKFGLEDDEVFCVEFIEEENKWISYIEEKEIQSYQAYKFEFADEEELDRLKSAPKVDSILEVDMVPLRRKISDQRYKKPISPFLYGILDVKSEKLISHKLSDPGDDVEDLLVKELIRYIETVGIPVEIRTSNRIVKYILADIAEMLDIKLKMKKISGVCSKFGEYILYTIHREENLLN